MNARISMTARQAAEYREAHTKLVHVVEFVLVHWPIGEFLVTRIVSSREENITAGAKSQIHVVGPPWRALDARIRTLGDHFQEEAETVARHVNNRFAYDPGRPHLQVAIARLHGSGPHLHLQVHPNTVATRSEGG